MENIPNADDAVDRVLIANTPVQGKCLLHSQEQAARGIGLDMNSDKTEFMCFKQDGVISALRDKPLKLADHFRYLDINISSTESSVNKCKGKVQIAVNWLLNIWKSNLSHKIKKNPTKL